MHFAQLTARTLLTTLAARGVPKPALPIGSHSSVSLLARQSNSCEVECGDDYCMPRGADCCAWLGYDGYHCDPGYYCVAGMRCCPIGKTCDDEDDGDGMVVNSCEDMNMVACGSKDLCIPADGECCGNGQYCPAGSFCTADNCETGSRSGGSGGGSSGSRTTTDGAEPTGGQATGGITSPSARPTSSSDDGDADSGSGSGSESASGNGNGNGSNNNNNNNNNNPNTPSGGVGLAVPGSLMALGGLVALLV